MPKIKVDDKKVEYKLLKCEPDKDEKDVFYHVLELKVGKNKEEFSLHSDEKLTAEECIDIIADTAAYVEEIDSLEEFMKDMEIKDEEEAQLEFEAGQEINDQLKELGLDSEEITILANMFNSEDEE